MSLYDACERHCVPHAGCLDCIAAKNSMMLHLVRVLRAGTLTPEQQARLDKLRRRHENPDPADLPDGTQVRTFGWQELVERLERDVAGDAT